MNDKNLTELPPMSVEDIGVYVQLLDRRARSYLISFQRQPMRPMNS